MVAECVALSLLPTCHPVSNLLTWQPHCNSTLEDLFTAGQLKMQANELHTTYVLAWPATQQYEEEMKHKQAVHHLWQQTPLHNCQYRHVTRCCLWGGSYDGLAAACTRHAS